MKTHGYDHTQVIQPRIIRGPHAQGDPTAMEQAWQCVARRKAERRNRRLNCVFWFAAGWAAAALVFCR